MKSIVLGATIAVTSCGRSRTPGTIETCEKVGVAPGRALVSVIVVNYFVSWLVLNA